MPDTETYYFKYTGIRIIPQDEQLKCKNGILTYTVDFRNATEEEKLFFPQTYEERVKLVRIFLIRKRNIPARYIEIIPTDEIPKK